MNDHNDVAPPAGEDTDDVPTGPTGPTEEYPQPVQEIVDPRVAEPLAERERTSVAGHRTPDRQPDRRSTEPAPTTDATVGDDQLDVYNEEQRSAFESHYRDAMERFGDEERAIEIAHAAAKGTPGDR